MKRESAKERATAPDDFRVDRTMSIDASGSLIGTPLPSSAGAARYVIMGELARGGLGRILSATDERLNRPVAIKQLLSPDVGVEQLQRFQREAAITARLQHPAIVPVYDAGNGPDGQPFYVMKLLSKGRTLKEAAAEARDFPARLALLPTVITVADAIAYAHSLGIVHRDIKPSNVILGPFGETVVIDWGLAKDLAVPSSGGDTSASPYRTAAPDATSVGAVMGTPHYMAPEQARGEPIDCGADVYALGALLYHLLAGVAPFDGGTATEVVQRVASGQAPVPLGRLERGISPELVTIVDKAMQQQPSQRYPSAEALADELKRFQTGQLVRAHDYSTSALVLRWVRRHKLPAAIAAIFVATLALTLTASIRRIRGERSVAIAERNRLILAQAHSALDSDPTLAVEWLKTYPRDGTDWAEAQTVAADAQSRGIALHLLPTMAQSIALFPDGKRVVTGGPDNQVQVWDLLTGQRLHAASFDADVHAVRIAPDGQTLAVAVVRGDVYLWSLQDGARKLLGKHDSGAFRLAFAPTGGRLASAGLHSVALWDLASGRQLASIASRDVVTTLSYSPDGETVVFGTAGGTLNLWQPASGGVRPLTGHVGAVNCVAFSRDGAQLLTGGNDHTVRLWERASGRSRILGSHDDLVRVVAFSPVAPLAASGGVDHKVRLWSLDGKPGRVFGVHTDTVNDVAFSPDGRTLASLGPDHQVQLWELATGDERVLRGHRGDLGDALFSPDGRTLTTSGYDEHTRVWSVAPNPSTIVGRHRIEATDALFSPDGAWVASVGSDKMARLWNLATGQERPLPGADDFSKMGLATGARFSADGKLLVAAGDNGAHAWNLATGATHTLVLDQGLARALAISADGATVAIGGSDGKIRLWDLRSDRVQLLAGHEAEVLALAFSGTGLLASTGGDATVRLWDLASGTSRILGKVAGSGTSRLAFAPDGQTLATADSTFDIQLWTAATGAKRTLHGHSDSVWALAFSRDGRRLATASRDRSARVWDLDRGTVRVLLSHEEPLRAIAFSADGNKVATGSNDQTIRIWDLDNDALAILRGHRAAVRSTRFSSDGTKLVSASEDGTIRLWDLGRVRFVPRDRAALVAWMGRQTTATLSATENSSNATQRRTE